MGADLARLLVFGIGLVLAVVGAVAASARSSAAGLYPLFIGLALIVAAVIERVRYRSSEAETIGRAHPGPAAASPPAVRSLDPRFRPTEERFEDPTTGVRMRVWLDPVGRRTAVRAPRSDPFGPAGSVHRARAILAGQPGNARSRPLRDGRRRTRSASPDHGRATPPSRHEAGALARSPT